ncbi:cytochrome P450 [Piscibacillus sp. B03]|uniref:cytochrome P450 n=1 Tax=Piscibacillus sp. B03 TaxID=3457430 RepID=UPI003FCCB796
MSEHHKKIPKETGIDHSIELLKEGYNFILNRVEKFDSRVVQTRLLGEKAICMVGKNEAELFYDTDKFFREEAAPSRVQKTLLGVGGVQGLDGEEHRHRKAMFMSFMTRDSLNEVQNLTKREWERVFAHSPEEVNIYETAKIVLTRVALNWAGVPYKEVEIKNWSKRLSPLFEMAANIGPKHIKSRRSRKKLEQTLQGLVKKLREGQLDVNQSSPFYNVSMHRDSDGNLLDPHVAAVEILNLIRPIVAIAVYVDFTLLAVYEHPDQVCEIQNGHIQSQHFIQEVRRYYPFFPFAVARVKKDFTWNGFDFKKNTMTLLDLYGTNHDPTIWESPNEFKPSRFKEWQESPFNFIPQGGGEFDFGHRCAGEWLTIDVMRVTLEYFLHEINFRFPEQNPEYDMNDIPPVPGVMIHLKG